MVSDMIDPLQHICHTVTGREATFMVVGSVGCFLHCAGSCALCLSGGTTLGMALYRSFQLVVSRLAPALITLSMPLFLCYGSSSL